MLLCTAHSVRSCFVVFQASVICRNTAVAQARIVVAPVRLNYSVACGSVFC
ncbi:hypothetical protein [Methanogenium cariaci]|uniref:hypothetical protein n=1 Tax=Methanogenium cariaci TaxID=2197 RepID=UPI0012F6ED7D|nr:hypothetical protein [Methanogenium cariaci]